MVLKVLKRTPNTYTDYLYRAFQNPPPKKKKIVPRFPQLQNAYFNLGMLEEKINFSWCNFIVSGASSHNLINFKTNLPF